MDSDQTKQRFCRCCNRRFEYPVPKSRATRFHCPDCAQLKPELRKVFEQFNRRLKQVAVDLDKVKQPRSS